MLSVAMEPARSGAVPSVFAPSLNVTLPVGAPEGDESVAVIVTKGETSLTLASSPNPSVTGKTVTFTATLKASQPASGAAEIFADDKSLGTFQLAASSGTYTTKDLPAGPHKVRVTYAGNDSFNGAESVAITQTVNAAPPPSGGPGTSSSSSSSSSGSTSPADGATAADEGCHVANVGSSTMSRLLSFGALALGLMLAIRRRRR